MSGSCCYDFGSTIRLIQDGQAPCYREISSTSGNRIAYHVTKNSDLGKTCKIFGYFYGGQPLQEQDALGAWSDGITITAISAGGTPGEGGTVLPAMTGSGEYEKIAKITHVVREETDRMAYLYEYDGTDLIDNGAYEPSETTPMYRRYSISNYSAIPKVTDSYGRSAGKIKVMAKLQHIPVSKDSDFLLIDDFDALKYAVQAIKKEEAGDDQGAETSWHKAIRELNFTDRNKSPGQQVVVKVSATGSRRTITNPI